MICVYCSSTHTKVTNSRPHKKLPIIWRRRRCAACHRLFTTDERPRLSQDKVVRSFTLPETSTRFNPGKLLISIAKSFQHDTEEGVATAWDLTETVMTHLSVTDDSLTTMRIAEITHATLDRYDKKAAISYALQHGLHPSLNRR